MKKLLALVLALVMVMGLSVVSTNAAFKDDEKIDHTEAVEVMNSLGIIAGKPGGNFDPDGSVTRAEMAKMVSIALLGEIDPAAFAGAASDLTDISGHWAEGYIKFCVSNGIVSGKGNGIFDPDAQVTTVEAAKMLLVALGYNADIREYKGDQWTLPVMRDAQQKGLLKSLTKAGTTVAMDRDDAAQMIYNTLKATRVVEQQSINAKTGEVTLSYVDAATKDAAGNAIRDAKLLGKTFEAVNEVAYLTGRTYNQGKDEFTYTFSANANFNTDAITGNDAWNGGAGGYTSKTDYTELWGRRVNVVYDEDKNIIGIYPNENSTVLYSGIMKDIPDDLKATDTSMKLGGTNYSLINGENATANDYFYDFLNGAIAQPFYGLNYNTLLKPYEIEVIDNDGDGRINLIVVHPFKAARVTYVSGTSFNIGNTAEVTTLAGAQAATKSNIKKADVIVYDDIAKDDFVKVTAAANAVKNLDTYEKIDTIEGKITGWRTDVITVDGTAYNLLNKELNNNNCVDDSYLLAAVNGYIFGLEKTKSGVTSSDYAIVVNTGTGIEGKQAKLLFSDGTEKIVDTKNDYGTAGGEVNVTLPAGTTNNYTTNAAKPDTTYVGDLVTYKLESGKYVLTPAQTVHSAANATAAGFDSIIDAPRTYNRAGTNDATIGAAKIADDATVFVYNTTDKDWDVISGKQLKRYNTATIWNAYANDDSKTGYSTVDLAYATVGGARVGDEYAYVTGNVNSTRNDKNERVYEVAGMWTKDGAVSKFLTNDSSDAISKRNIVTYSDEGDGVYELKVATGFRRGAVIAWDGTYATITDSSLIKGNGNIKVKVTGDTTIIGIDTDAPDGVEGATIALANENGDTVAANDYFANIYFKVVDENAPTWEADTIFVDTYMDAPTLPGTVAATASVGATPTTAAVMALFASKEVTLDATTAWAPADSLVIPAGVKLTVTGADGMTIAATKTLDLNGTLKAEGTVTITTNGKLNIGENGVLDLTASNQAFDMVKVGTVAQGATIKTGTAATANTNVAIVDATDASTTNAVLDASSTYQYKTVTVGNTTNTGWVKIA
jgi:hypothetical protein